MNNEENNKEINNKRNMEGIGALPLLILIGLILVAGYFLFRGEFDFSLPEPSDNIQVRRLEEYPTKIHLSEEKDKAHSVIKSEQELVEFLASIDETNQLTLNEKINFDREYLIGVVSKTFDTGGYEYRVRRVYLDDKENGILVSSTIKKPGDDCMTTQEIYSIVDLVAISKTDREPKFETITETYNCSDE